MRYLEGPDPLREQRRQSRMLDRLSTRYAVRLRDEIRRASLDALGMWEATGEIPMPRDHLGNLEAIFRSMAVDAVQAFAGRVVDQGKSLGRIEVKETFAARFFRLALEYAGLEAVRRRITAIAETTRAQIVARVRRGLDQGQGVREIAQGIRADVPGISRDRAAVIARTETHGAANFGADQAARMTGLALRKEWVSAEDERTRLAHVEANEQRVGMDEPFIVGGEPLMFPGDPNGSAWNVINCRCSVAHVVLDDL